MEVKEYCNNIEETLRELISSGEDGNDANGNWALKQNPQVEVMLDTFNKVGDYLDGMIGFTRKGTVVGKVERIDPTTGQKYYTDAVGEQDMTQKTFNERKKLSASLVKSLGFTKLPGVNLTAEESANRLKELSKREQIKRAQQANLPDDAFDDDDDDSFPDQWANYGRRPSRANSVVRGQLSSQMEQFQRDLENANWSRQPREDMAHRKGTSFFGDQTDLADQVEDARLRNPFRGSDAGEAQAQGLEEGAQEVNPFDLPPVDYRPASRRPSGTSTPRSGAITPRSGRSSRSGRPAEAAVSAQPAVSAPEKMIPTYDDDGKAIMLSEAEWKRRYNERQERQRVAEEARVARLPPFPYTSNVLYNTTTARLVAIARELTKAGYGKYDPKETSKVQNVRDQMFVKFPQFLGKPAQLKE